LWKPHEKQQSHQKEQVEADYEGEAARKLLKYEPGNQRDPPNPCEK
jgi:hypothetical protein